MSAAKIPHRRPIRSGSNSTVGEKFAERVHGMFAVIFGGRTVIKLVAVFVALVVIAGAIVWYENVYLNPKNVFWGMVDGNLSTYSVTRETGQKSSSTNNTELTQLVFGPKPYVRDIKEQDTKTGKAASQTKIKIESIGTPTDTYQHYILVSQPVAKDKPKPDYSSIYPLWIKNGGNGQASDPALFENALFSGFLFGNLPAAERTKVVNDLQDAYSVNFNNVQKQKDHGRRVYDYSVSVNLKDYAKAAKIYAKSMGLSFASQINPASYQSSSTLALNIKIDVLSRQLRQISYKSTGTAENYSSYGVLANQSIPSQTVSYSVLQAAVEKAAAGK